MNALVMAFNGGQMPVLWPGGCAGFPGDYDIIHSCMTHATHLKWLADWVVIRGFGIASPGDFLEWLSDLTLVPAAFAWLMLMLEGTQKAEVKPKYVVVEPLYPPRIRTRQSDARWRGPRV